jgi:PEP-CTERM motif
MNLNKRTILAGTVPLAFVAAIHTSAWANPAKGADVIAPASTQRQEHRTDQGSARACKHDSDEDKDRRARKDRGAHKDRDAHKDRGDNDRRDNDRDDYRDLSGSPPGSSNAGTPASVPEPGMLALFGLGVLGTVLAQRRRRAILG